MKHETIVCPFCGNGHAHITYEENRVYQMNCPDCHNAIFHQDVSWDAAVAFFKHITITDDDRLEQLCAAEKDVRLVMLPCKVGDICYEVDPGHPGVIKHTVTGTTVYNRRADGNRYMTDFVNVITIDTWAVAEDGCEWDDQYTVAEWADAPKTRPEAEAALNDAHKPGGEQE